MRVSHGLSCPRRAAIEASEDYYVDPLSMNATLTGTAWHKMMESGYSARAVKAANQYDIGNCEQEVHGTIAGVKLSGKIDRLRDDLIEDWKTTGGKIPDVAKPEHIAQLSLYAELAKQSGLRKPSIGIMWYKGSWEIKSRSCSLMPIDEALAVKPYGGSFTVGELLNQANDVMQANDYFGVDAQGWKHLPLAGSTMSFGSKSMCQFCSVESICMTEERGAPF